MRSLFLAVVFGLSAHSLKATDELYINSGFVNQAPQIDAFGFLNEGTFDISTSYPFDTSNTRSFTNSGSMTGSVGWRFDTATSNGRKRAANFINEGTITSSDSGIFINGGNFSSIPFLTRSYLLIDATNVVSPGPLSVGPNGLLKIDANVANLRGGALLAAESANQTGFSFFDNFAETNYFGENKVVELHWGVGTNGAIRGQGNPLDLSQFAVATAPSSGDHEVIEYSSGFLLTNSTFVPNFFSSTNGSFAAYAYTSPNYVAGGATNQNVQVVFVSTNAFDTNLMVDVRFSQNGGPSTGTRPIVRFSVADRDVITDQTFTNAVYLGDNSFAATRGTNTLFLQRRINGTYYRPNPYDITFLPPIQWNGAATNNTPYNTALLYDPVNNPNTEVTNVYSGYSVAIGVNAATDSNLTPAQSDPTNSVGRIEINANELNLNLARMRSEGLLTIKTTNFAELTEGARLDAQQINFNIATTNQTLTIANMLAGNVKRISGQLHMWSGVWTNADPSGVRKIYHVLIVDNNLSSTLTTTAYGFSVTATNQPHGQVVLGDPITIGRSLLINSENLVVRSNLTVVSDLGPTNWPILLNLTNEGFMNIPGNAVFSRPSGAFQSLVNIGNQTLQGGVILANGINANTLYLQNSGYLATRSGSITVSNSAGIFDLGGGQILSSIDVTLFADQVKFSNSVVAAGYDGLSSQPGIGGTVTVTANKLTEAGTTNSISAVNGVRLNKQTVGPWEGDLLNTVILSKVRPLTVVRHFWSGLDFGVSNTGYTNNAAVGILRLDGGNSCRFRFSSPDASVKAIYVDYLDLLNFATNFQTALEIDPNFRIYFAGASIPAEKLDNTHGGRLRWVKSYAGLNSSTTVLINGQPVKVNKALAESKELDSDADGIPNGFDASPFDPASPAVGKGSTPATIAITWNAAANTTYTVEAATELGSPTTWTVVRTVTTGPSSGPVTIEEPITGDPKYFRISYQP